MEERVEQEAIAPARHTRIAYVALIIGLAAVFLVSPQLRDLFFNIAVWLNGYVETGGVYAMASFAALAGVSAMFSFFTSVPLVPFAVAAWGSELTSALLLLGWTLGGAGAYIIGRYFGYPMLSFFVNVERVKTYETYVAEHLPFARMFLLRITLPAEVLGYALGIVRYRFWPYLLATALAEAPFAVATTYLTDAVIAQEMSRFILWAGVSLALALLVGIVLAARARRRKG